MPDSAHLSFLNPNGDEIECRCTIESPALVSSNNDNAKNINSPLFSQLAQSTIVNPTAKSKGNFSVCD